MGRLARSCLAGMLLGIVLAQNPSPALADESQILFVCGSGPESAPTNLLELRAVQQDDGRWTDVQFYGFSQDLVPLRYPLSPSTSGANFFFSNSNGPNGYLVNVRFSVGDEQFRLYSLRHLPKGDDIGGSEGGLEIIGGDGNTRKIVCDESPYMFIAYMRDAMSCDLDNVFGPSGCDPDRVPYDSQNAQ